MNDTRTGRTRLGLDALLEFIESRRIAIEVIGRGVDACVKATIPPKCDSPQVRRLLADNEDGLLDLFWRRRLFETRTKHPPRRWNWPAALKLLDASLARIRALYLLLPLESRAAALRALEGGSLRIEQWCERKDLLGLSRALTAYENKIAVLTPREGSNLAH